MEKDEFYSKYQSYETGNIDEVLGQWVSDNKLGETIAWLIEHREELRDQEIKRLEAEAKKLIEALEEIDRDKLLEELRCFKDVLALQRRVVERSEDRHATRS